MTDDPMEAPTTLVPPDRDPSKSGDPETWPDQHLVVAAIALSGRSARRWATEIIRVNERTARRWIDGTSTIRDRSLRARIVRYVRDRLNEAE